MRVLAYIILAAVALGTPAARADDAVQSEAQAAFERGDFRAAVKLAADEIKVNPGHEEAYIVLARSYEKLEDKEQAAAAWEQVKKITRVRERIQEARLGLLRTRGPEVPKHNPNDVWENDPYKVDIGKVPWDRLKADVEGAQLQYNGDYPPVLVESPYFRVYACTQRMGEIATQLCEKYMDFLLKKYFYAGQEWSLRLPILIYKDHNDYVNIGKYPAASAGVTASDPQTGMPILIALYMLDDEGNFDHESVEGTLPHEIVHMVINEWFGGADVPRWINEGLARRMEQTRNHYKEAAKIGRDAMAGEYFRFRDLFAQEQYPVRGDRTFRFYEQSASIVLFLLEQFGPDAAVAFFETLKQGGSHDDAAAAAMGIAPEGAVEELEKRWVDWICGIYLRFADRLEEGEIAQATAIDDPVFAASFGESVTADKIEKWAPIRSDSMNAFKDIGGSSRNWKSEGDKLVCTIGHSEIGTLIGIRTDEEPPMVLRCTARATAASVDKPTIFGLTMLDHRSDDTGIQVSVALEDNGVHEIQCVVSDDIALYIDGICVGRAPALRDIGEVIDWPLAFVAGGPLEIWEIKAARILEFLPAVAQAPPTP